MSEKQLIQMNFILGWFDYNWILRLNSSKVKIIIYKLNIEIFCNYICYICSAYSHFKSVMKLATVWVNFSQNIENFNNSKVGIWTS